jgi:hypothetical protein
MVWVITGQKVDKVSTNVKSKNEAQMSNQTFILQKQNMPTSITTSKS